MTATVNGVATTPDAQGNVQGSFTEASHLAGDGGNNILQGNHGNDYFFGGAGNDTFKITAASLAHSSSAMDNGIQANDVIYDFSGAGGWAASNNDFLALTGFGAGSTLTFNHYGHNADTTENSQLQYYTLHDTTTGNDYTIFIKSLNSKLLVTGDYAFYNSVAAPSA